MPIAKAARTHEFVAALRERLPEDKVAHCVSVAEYLSSFAETIGLDHDTAVAAGLLHDLCRGLGNDEILRLAVAYGLPIREVQLQRPILLHGALAAEECRRNFGLTDPDFYEALYWHTTGRPGLGLLGQALYHADFAEPLRKYPEAAEARAVLQSSGFPAALL
ncbi:MAG: bis(5'-nucleosyl)-tetraphosphatase (symmetrical) YqeK, partial [Candidatus Hydrogenedentes bacterium]|nr:bis(5'-nucleosyl)-tetraphosphatase (symmetrical) YqeK [Candidatus Hydrogenedentota bacterium]